MRTMPLSIGIIHFVGIGGIGMSGIAEILHNLGYTVQGTVSYAGANTGQIYLALNSTTCNDVTGTSIAAPGAFTIRGVPPGNYVLQAYMDLAALGNGSPNTSDPTGATAGFTISNANLTGQLIALTDNNPTVLPSSRLLSVFSITPTDQGVVIGYLPVSTTINGNQWEAATSYDVQWSTDPTFATSPAIRNFKANGTKSEVWILNNGTSGVTGSPFANGTPYYFEARARNSFGPAPTWEVWTGYGGSTPLAVTPGASTSGIEVQGSVTIPAVAITPAAQLYVGFLNMSTYAIYGTRIAAPVAGANAYTIYVPSDSNPDYINIAVLDQNNDGLIDAGDVSNTGDNQSNGIAITSALTRQDPPLPNTTVSAKCDSILPVSRSRVTMPRALPSTTIRSSISVRGCISTCPAAICRSSAWYAPRSSCCPVWPRA